MGKFGDSAACDPVGPTFAAGYSWDAFECRPSYMRNLGFTPLLCALFLHFEFTKRASGETDAKRPGLRSERHRFAESLPRKFAARCPAGSG